MPSSHAVVPTANASRYLQQLCKHWAHKFPVEFTPEQGSIDLPAGRTSLRAGESSLAIVIDAPDPAAIERLEGVVADHIRRFAFREELAFAWRRAGMDEQP